MDEWVAEIADAVDTLNWAIEEAKRLRHADMTRRLADTTVKLGLLATAIAISDAGLGSDRGFGASEPTKQALS